jgi:hypothetical protein
VSLREKIYIFDYLSWVSVISIFLSFWQIIIPFLWVDRGPEQALGYLNVCFFIYSLLLLSWVRLNLYEHKKKLKEELINNDHHQHEEDNIAILEYGFGKFYFILSILMIIGYFVLILGSNLY